MMTPAQEQVLDQILTLSREHFDGCLIVVDEEGECEFQWVGGKTRALGMARRAEHALLRIIDAENPIKREHRP